MSSPQRLLYRTAVILLLLAFARPLNAQRLAPDPSFRRPLLESSESGRPLTTTLAAHPDGGVVVATNAAYINGTAVAPLAKLRADGSVDPTFAPTDLPAGARVVHIDADGRMLVEAGDRLLRLLPNGTKDPSYTELRFNRGPALRVHPLSDGRLLASLRPGMGEEDIIVFLLPQGGIAPGFRIVGRASDIALQSDGKMVIAGSVLAPSNRLRNVARVHPDGSLDLPFDPDLPAGSTWVSVLSDGKILIASGDAVKRLQPDGRIDAAYTPNFGSQLASGTLRRVGFDGAFYFIGTVFNSIGVGGVQGLRRLNPQGASDPTFVMPNVGLNSGGSRDDLVTWNERTFYLTPSVSQDPSARVLVSQGDSHGTLNPSFAPRFSHLTTSISRVVRQPDGKYLVSGLFDHVDGTVISDRGVNCIRLNPDSSQDPSFQVATLATPTGISRPTPVAIQPDGRAIAFGYDGLWRLNANGSRDTAFPPVQASQFAMARDGSFVAMNFQGQLLRYSSEGVRDTAFSVANVGDHEVAMTSDGKIFLLGTDRVVRLLPDGSIDPAYSPVLPANPQPHTFAVLSDGGFVACASVNPLRTGVRPLFRVTHYDPQGRRTRTVDIPGDLALLASLLWDIVSTQGGGPFSYYDGDTLYGGAVQIDGDEILVVPLAGTGTQQSLSPFSRFRPSGAGPQASLAPGILVHPMPHTVGRGATVSLTVQAYGEHDFTYQWYKDGAPISATLGTNPPGTLILRDIEAADDGDYQVEVRNVHGVARSTSARVRLIAAPVVTQQAPQILTIVPNQPLAITFGLEGQDMRVAWMHNNLLVYERTSIGSGPFTSFFYAPVGAPAGVYRALISNVAGFVFTQEIIVRVVPDAERSRLENVSVRTEAGTGERALIVGFVVAGDAPATLPVLLRGAGPALAGFGVTSFSTEPSLRLYRGSGLVAANSGWAGDGEIAAAAARVGAFPFADPRSRDAALYQPALSPGGYTIMLEDARGSGQVLAEVYSAARAPAATSARIANFSSRARVNSSDAPLIAGFSIAGQTACTVLVRGIGPALAAFGVPEPLAKAELSLYDSSGRKVMEATRYPTGSDYIRAGADVGAFAFTGDAGVNSAMLLSLPPGAYTAQLRGPEGSAGSALIEVYEVR